MTVDERDDIDQPVESDEDYEGGGGPGDDRELTAMEMMGAPNRPSDSARKAVLWLSLSFAVVLFTLTLAVIGDSGLDILTFTSAAILLVVIVALVGAVRYKGDDPMAQFDPPPRPKRRLFRRNR